MQWLVGLVTVADSFLFAPHQLLNRQKTDIASCSHFPHIARNWWEGKEKYIILEVSFKIQKNDEL